MANEIEKLPESPLIPLNEEVFAQQDNEGQAQYVRRLIGQLRKDYRKYTETINQIIDDMGIIRDSDGDEANVGSGGLDVNIQDQTTPVLIMPLNNVEYTTTISVATAVDVRTITVTSTTGFVAGKIIVLASAISDRYFVAHQVGVPAGNVITLDTPLDSVFDIGTQCTTGSDQLAVDGSSTTQVFSLRAAEPEPGIPIEIDITRVLIQCITATAIEMTDFGDIAGGLDYGIVLRSVDGTTSNIFNVKSNIEIAGIMYDFEAYGSGVPAAGVDGFAARLTFGGQEKLGVVIRVGAGEDLEVLIQDDLSSLTSLKIIVEGHVVEPD